MDSTSPHPRRPFRWFRFLLAFAVSTILGAGWMLASPLMSVPDEPSHAVRAAAVEMGAPLDFSTEVPTVVLPRYIARAYFLPCFVSTQVLSAGCQTPPDSFDPMLPTTTATTADSNSPVYYAIVGVPSGWWHDDTAFYAMRTVNVLLCAIFIGLAFLALGDLARRTWTTMALAVAMTPTYFFLQGSINPNALELSASVALLLTLVAALRHPAGTRLMIERVGVMLLSAALLVSTRSISLVWALLIVLIAVILTRREQLVAFLRSRIAIVGLIGAGAVAGVSIVWYVLAERLTTAPEASHISFLYGAGVTFARTSFYWDQWVGTFGWLATPAPSLTYVIWYPATIGLVVAALLSARGRSRVAAFVGAGAAVVLPPLLQGTLVGTVGIIWQGRYALALYAICLVVAGLALDDRFGRVAVARPLIVVAVSGLAVAHMAAFGVALHTSTMGTGPYGRMFAHPEWSPPLGVIGILAAMGLVVLGSGVVLLASALRAQRLADAPGLTSPAG